MKSDTGSTSLPAPSLDDDMWRFNFLSPRESRQGPFPLIVSLHFREMNPFIVDSLHTLQLNLSHTFMYIQYTHIASPRQKKPQVMAWRTCKDKRLALQALWWRAKTNFSATIPLHSTYMCMSTYIQQTVCVCVCPPSQFEVFPPFSFNLWFCFYGFFFFIFYAFHSA